MSGEEAGGGRDAWFPRPFLGLAARVRAFTTRFELYDFGRWLLLSSLVGVVAGLGASLLTWGIEDLAFTPAFMDTFRRDFERTRAVRLEAKHFIQEDAPGEVSQAIMEFLQD